MSALLENGIDVTALHNHFLWDEPRMYYMHVHAHGKPADLAIISRIKGIAPSNLSLPSVSGKKRVGQKVRCNPGSWSALPSSYSFTWLRNGSPVSTGRQRKLRGGDQGQSIACSVKAKNPFGTSGTVTSPAEAVH